MKTQHRLTKQYERTDQTTLTDRLATICANVENAFLQVGAQPAADYSHLDLMQLAVALACSPIYANAQGRYDLTLEDIEPDRVAQEAEFQAAMEGYVKDKTQIRAGQAVTEIFGHAIGPGASARVGAWLAANGWTCRREDTAERSRIWTRE